MTPVWVKPLACVLALLASAGFGWYANTIKHKADRADQLQADMDAVQAAMARAGEADARLLEELRKPKAGPEIREIVRNNPSECVLPRAVFDGLLKGIRDTNAATR